MPDGDGNQNLVVVDPNRITVRLTLVVAVIVGLAGGASTWINLTRDVKSNGEAVEALERSVDRDIEELDDRVEELEDESHERRIDMVRLQEKLTSARNRPGGLGSPSAGMSWDADVAEEDTTEADERE